MKKLSYLTLLALALAMTAGNALALKPRVVFEKYLWADGVDSKARHLDRVEVKFFDEDMVRLRDGRLISTNGRNSLGNIQDFLARHPEVQVQGIITSMTEEDYEAMIARNEQLSGQDLVDLFSFYLFILPQPAADPKALLGDILNAPEVETAYYEPIPYEATCTDVGNTTPNFEPNQGYHNPAPTGTDLDYPLGAFGGSVVHGAGTGVWMAVVEARSTGRPAIGAKLDHEDYTLAVNATPEVPNLDSLSYHAGAVAGIMGACDDNGVGVLGYMANEEIRFYDINALASIADVYTRVNSNLIAGEVCNSSWGYFSNPMPPGQSCPCNPGQNGMVPPEYSASVKSAIQNGVAGGIHYFMSAGNGCTNLDDATFGTTFRYSTDSGSNYIGAVKSTLPHDSACFTCYGERVDLCGWGENVYTVGYGTAFTGQGRREYYASGFNGTSSASPIVAGCAGVLNNIYRDINAGANISTSTMRTWLQQGGTEAGAFPGADDPEQPNLFAITSPDLNPDLRTGWSSYYVIPRNTGDADGSNCILPTNLIGEPGTTYWNVAWENTSNFGTATPAYTRTYRDDVWIFWASFGSMGPLGRGYYTNASFPPGTDVRGGRHTLRLACDPLDEVTEYYEDNNSATLQLVWNPRGLTAETPLTFSAPPVKTVTDQPSPIYYNCDGYSFSSGFGGFWDLLGVCASTTAADYDTRIYSEAITSTNGFDDYEAWSGYVGPIDIVGKNQNIPGSVSGAAVINWDAENDDYHVEGETSDYMGTPGYGRNNAGSFTITASEIMEAVEFNVNELVPYTIEANVTGGNANLVISVFGPDDDYFSLSDRNATVNAGGPGQSEQLCFTPTQTGYHLALFHKYDSNDYNQTATFTAYIGKSEFDLTHNLNTGWSHKIVVRQASGSTPAVLPATLTGGLNTNYLNAGYINQGCVSSPSGLNDRFYLDGPAAYTTGSWAAHGPGTTTAWLNQGPIFVFGGRHDVGDSIDVFQEGAEWREDNNRWDEQFVWTPFAMSNQSVYTTTFTAPNFRDFQSAVTFPAWNQDGWRFSGTYWSGVAIMPNNADDNYLCALFDPTTGSTNGFESYLVPSFSTTDGSLNFVVENGNINGNPATFDVGALNNYGWPTVPSLGTYRMYQCNRIQDLQVDHLNGPFTMGTNHLINVFDVNLTSGVPKRFILDNMGSVDLGLAIFDADDAYGSRTANGHYANANGNGGDETLVFSPTTTGWHGVVVFKNDLTDLPSVQYRLIIGDRIPAAPMHMVLQTMNSQVDPIQMRAHWDSVTVDINGDPLNVDQYQLFYTLDPNLTGFPGGWIPYLTTTQATISFNVAVSAGYFRMVVVAQDADGYILSHSPLPDGSDLTGVQLSVPEMNSPEGGTVPVLGATGAYPIVSPPGN